MTPEQYRRRRKLQKLPPHFRVPIEPLPLAAGRVTFVRQVTPNGNIHLLGLTFKVGKRRHLTVYLHGHVFKRWPYPFLKS